MLTFDVPATPTFVAPVACRSAKSLAGWLATLPDDARSLDLSERGMTNATIAPLLAWPGLPLLERLRIGASKVKSDAVAELVARCAPSLVLLDLHGSAVKGDVVAALAEQSLPALETLVLDGTKLQRGFTTTRLDAPRLSALSVRECSIDKLGLEGLLQQPFVSALRLLAIDANRFKPSSVAAILDAFADVPLAGLHVDLHGKIGAGVDRYFAARARSAQRVLALPWDLERVPALDAFTGLEFLVLGKADASLLAQPAIQRVQRLDLQAVTLSPVPLENLRCLQISTGFYPDDEKRAAVRRWLVSQPVGLEALDLGWTVVDDALVAGLNELPILTELQRLRVPMRSPAAYAPLLARCPKLRVLAADSIMTDGMEAVSDMLARAAEHERLERLSIMVGDEFPRDALEALRASKPELIIELRPASANHAALDALCAAIGARMIGGPSAL